MDVKNVIKILQALRITGIYEEYEIQKEVAKVLGLNNIKFEKEYTLGPRNRIDFFLDNGIGIEIKKGKPNRTKVINQLERYARFSKVTSLILIIERNMDIPTTINDKPCFSIGLNKQWGIAL